MPPRLLAAAAIVFVCSVCGTSAKIGGWDTSPNAQYHIQTDEGPERYFKYQTVSGQYRKEKRLQDGTVVGSYGWVDANGYLRLRDYIADDKGYRIVRTKLVKVGVDTPIDNAITIAKKTPANAGVNEVAPVSLSSYSNEKHVYESTTRAPISYGDYVKQTTPTPISYDDYVQRTTPAPISYDNYVKRTTPAPISYDDYVKQSTTPRPISLSDYLREKQTVTPNVEVVHRGYPSTTAAPSTTTAEYVRPVTFRPYYGSPNSLVVLNKKPAYEARYEPAGSSLSTRYDGVSFTHNGFRYYLPRQYHEEETLPGDQRTGSFGYIDPFGIRRVVYYNTSPGSGFVHRKNNRYVGFQSTPYDPRFSS
ncbi:Insect cuticle protein [Nesidiocoris tenuis]|uniref:Insect cuticle protein n=1 Tax=Nesidiocoris tenuis TaxID=355587 RepID=A0ABN7ALW7_9HEMI|nr:Insect cuticle protein [Nesidiocoris tenuis]